MMHRIGYFFLWSKCCVLFFLLLSTMMVVVMGDPTPDRDESCEHWALIGECEKNPGYMLKECATSCHKGSNARQDMEKALMNIDSFFDLKANDLQGHVIDFAQFRNHITVITNVATYCGRTESPLSWISSIMGNRCERTRMACTYIGISMQSIWKTRTR